MPLENAVTPGAVLEMAQYLGIDVDSEWDLLWLARECLVEPLPPNWEVRTQLFTGHHRHRHHLEHASEFATKSTPKPGCRATVFRRKSSPNKVNRSSLITPLVKWPIPTLLTTTSGRLYARFVLQARALQTPMPNGWRFLTKMIPVNTTGTIGCE